MLYLEIVRLVLSPSHPASWVPNPFQALCLPMPSQEGGNSCFMNGDIWVAVNTTILKIACVSGLLRGSWEGSRGAISDG